MTDRYVTRILTWILEWAPPEMQITHFREEVPAAVRREIDDATLAVTSLSLCGPLFPGTSDGRMGTYVLGYNTLLGYVAATGGDARYIPADDVLIRPVPDHAVTAAVPEGPDVVRIAETVDELRQIRKALLLVECVESGNRERLALEAADIRKALHIGISPDFLRSISSDEVAKFGDANLAFVLQWFVYMATRWPMRLWPLGGLTGPLVPIPEGIAQIVWLALAHQVGAIALPFPRGDLPSLGFCAECKKPVFSTRTRRRGEHVFCDPPDDAGRSVCGNRFHSRETKRRATARRREQGGQQ